MSVRILILFEPVGSYFQRVKRFGAFFGRNGLPLCEEKLQQVERYKTLAAVLEWSRQTVAKLNSKKVLIGDGESLGLFCDMLWLLVVNDRAGLYG